MKILFTLCRNESEVNLICENFEIFDKFYFSEESNAKNECPWRYLKDGIFTDIINGSNKSKRKQTDILMD